MSGENPAKYNQGSQSSHQRKTKQQPVNLSRPFPFVTEMTSFQNNVTPLQNNLTSFQNSVRSLENSALSQNNPLLNNHMMATTQATGQTLLASSSAKVTPSITEEAAKSVSTEAKLDREISVTGTIIHILISGWGFNLPGRWGGLQSILEVRGTLIYLGGGGLQFVWEVGAAIYLRGGGFNLSGGGGLQSIWKVGGFNLSGR